MFVGSVAWVPDSGISLVIFFLLTPVPLFWVESVSHLSILSAVLALWCRAGSVTVSAVQPAGRQALHSGVAVSAFHKITPNLP